MRRYVAYLRLLPCILFVLWQATFVTIGIFAMVTDHSIHMQKPCKGCSFFQYMSFNTVFTVITLVTFFTWPGGGEGARARATLCTIIHFGLSTWGTLLWMQVGHECWTLLQSQYKTALAFHHMCVVTNFCLFAFYVLHEVYIGRSVGADLTLMPRAMCEPEKKSHEYVPAMGGPALGGEFVPAMGGAFPPHIPPGHMPPSVDHIQAPPSLGPVSPSPVTAPARPTLPKNITQGSSDPELAAVMSQPGDQDPTSVWKIHEGVPVQSDPRKPPVMSLP